MTKLRSLLTAALLLAIAASAAFLIAGAADRPLAASLPTDGTPLPSPRALSAGDGKLYVLDGQGSLRVLDYEGRLLSETQLVKTVRGFPAGITLAPDGSLLVADTHEARVRRLSPDLTEIASIGDGYGSSPGQFVYPQRIALLDGRMCVTEYGFGVNNRVQVFSDDGEFLRAFGGYGVEGGLFSRAADIVAGPDGYLYVADASHRVLRWTPDGEYLGDVGGPGREPGRLDYPYGLAADADYLYVAEYGTSRLSRFDFEGRFRGNFSDDLLHPRDLALAGGYLFIADTGHDRIVRVTLDRIPWTGGTLKRLTAVLALLIAASTARAEVAAEVRFGHGGSSIAGAVTQLLVELESHERTPLTFRVTGRIPGSVASGVRAESSGTLEPGSKKRVTLFFRPPVRPRYRVAIEFSRSVLVRLPDGETSGPKRTHELVQKPDSQVYASESPAAVQILAVGPQAGLLPKLPEGVRVMPVDEDDLPEAFIAYDSLDAVYWRNPGEVAPPDPVRFAALLRWVRLGGRLVVATRRPDRIRGTPLGEILPAEIRERPGRIDYRLVARRMRGGKLTEKQLEGLSTGPLLTLRPRDTALPGERVFLVERRLGLGSVTILAYDPAGFAEAGEEVGTLLIATLIGETDPEAMSGQGLEEAIEALELSSFLNESANRDYLEAVADLLRTGAVRAPPMGLLSLFMLLYVLAVGPIDYYILKKRGLLKYSALTFLGIAVLFTATAYLVSFHLFSVGTRVNRVTLVDIVPGPEEDSVDRVLIQDFAGFYEPTGGTLSLAPPGEVVALSQFDRPQDYVEGGAPRLLADPLLLDLASPLEPVGRLSVPFRSLRAARIVSYREKTMPLDVIADRGESITVRNGLDFILRDAVVVSQDEAFFVGDVAPGAEVTRDWKGQVLGYEAFQRRWTDSTLPDAKSMIVDDDALPPYRHDSLSLTARSLQTISAARSIAALSDDPITRGQLAVLAKWGIDRSAHLSRGGLILLAWTEKRGIFALPGDDEEGLTINVLRKVVTQ